MERSEAIREFNDCKFYVIKALELIKDDSLKFAFMGRYNVKLFNAAEKIGKVHDYILDAKYGSMQIFKELLNLRTTTRELRNEAILKGYDPFAVTCDIIIDIIDDVEKWESDNGNQGEVQNSEIGDKGIMENVLTRDEIIKGVEGINPFKPLNSDEPINYEEYYKRLCNGGVIDSRYGLDLFTYCVDRADISKIIARPKKRKDSKKPIHCSVQVIRTERLSWCVIISCHGLTRTASTTSVWKISVWSILTSWRVPDFDFCKHLSVLYRRHAVKPQFYSLVIIVIDIIFQVFDEGPCCHSLLSLISQPKSLARMMQLKPSGSHCLRYQNWPLTMQKSCGML